MTLRPEEWVGIGCTLLVAVEIAAHIGVTIQFWAEERLQRWRIRREVNRFVKRFGKGW